MQDEHNETSTGRETQVAKELFDNHSLIEALIKTIVVLESRLKFVLVPVPLEPLNSAKMVNEVEPPNQKLVGLAEELKSLADAKRKAAGMLGSIINRLEI